MYHIVKQKSGKFQVVLVGNNGELLSTSELLNTKQAAWKNVVAQLNASKGPFAYVQDDATKGSVLYTVNMVGEKWVSNDIPVKPKYTPGKNPKKKK